MKSKKVTMLAAALVVAVVALAGIGYAATSYTAKTTNTDNGLNSVYLTATQGGSGDYTNNFFTGVYFNSENTKSTTDSTSVTVYKPVCDWKVVTSGDDKIYQPIGTNATDGTLAKVSNVLKLRIDSNNNAAETATVAVKATTGFTPVAGLTYTIILATPGTEAGTFKLVGTPAALTTGDTWSFSSVPIAKIDDTSQYVEYSVIMFISGTTTGAMDSHAGFAAAPSTPDDDTTSETIFEFTVTATST